MEYAGYLYDAWNHILIVRLNLDHTVRGRVASYVWGPDIGSSWTGQSSWQPSLPAGGEIDKGASLCPQGEVAVRRTLHQQAGGVGGLLMVIDGVATSQHSGTTWDPIDDAYVDSLAPHARLALRAAVGSLPRLPPVALIPLMDRMRNVTGYKKAHTSVLAAQLDAIYDYDAFGQEIRSTGPAADTVPYHFSTKRVDSTTGLVYYGYRWYDPAKGRWISRDPIGEAGGINTLTFNRNTPVLNIDIFGLTGGSPPDFCSILIYAGHSTSNFSKQLASKEFGQDTGIGHLVGIGVVTCWPYSAYLGLPEKLQLLIENFFPLNEKGECYDGLVTNDEKDPDTDLQASSLFSSQLAAAQAKAAQELCGDCCEISIAAKAKDKWGSRVIFGDEQHVDKQRIIVTIKCQ